MLLPATAAGLAILLTFAATTAASAQGIEPRAGIKLEVHDHANRDTTYHAEFHVSGQDPHVLRLLFVDVPRCGEQPFAERVPVAADGTVAVATSFQATDPATGLPQVGSFELHAQFVRPDRLAGTFRVSEAGCDTGEAAFTAEPAGAGHHGGHGSGDHGDGSRVHRHGGGQDHQPDIGAATPGERAQAERLLAQTKLLAARRFPTYRAALRAGYVTHPDGEDGKQFFHVENCDYWTDRRRFDPRRPESLVYWRRPGRAPVLAAYMYRVSRSRKPPKLGGPVVQWHYHVDERNSAPGPTMMTHIWLTDTLATAYRQNPPVATLGRLLGRGGTRSSEVPGADSARHLTYRRGECSS